MRSKCALTCLALMTAILMPSAPTVASQSQPTNTEPVRRSEDALKGFELYCEIAATNVALADDHIDEGTSLLYYRLARFVSVYGKATPADAIKAAAVVVQVPEVKKLGERLSVRPLEVERRAGATAAADEAWLKSRVSALLDRNDLGPVLALITDHIEVPLPGRVRVDILPDIEREEQIEVRVTALLTALQSFRNSSAMSAPISDEDSKAALQCALEELERDYCHINDHLVKVRGHAARLANVNIQAVARVILDWVGPAVTDLEGATKITLAPVESGWVIVDATTGWSVRDPTIGQFSERDVTMIQRGLQANIHSTPATIGKHTTEAPNVQKLTTPPSPLGDK